MLHYGPERAELKIIEYNEFDYETVQRSTQYKIISNLRYNIALDKIDLMPNYMKIGRGFGSIVPITPITPINKLPPIILPINNSTKVPVKSKKVAVTDHEKKLNQIVDE
jgi:hypothetical protein